MLKRFGKEPEGERLQEIKRTKNYSGGSFQNIEKTPINPDSNFLQLLLKFLNKPDTVKPSKVIPNVKQDLYKLPEKGISVVWFGHSSYLLKLDNLNILVDPVFSGNASPVKFFGKAFAGANEYQVADMPEIDILFITHDHYDHLDYNTIVALKSKVKSVITSLGVGSHLEFWGYSKNIITELNWWEEYSVTDKLRITATPSRHFSGRALKRFKTLWSSFVLEYEEKRIFLGGDSGYSKTFKEIGAKFGKFDLAFLECGQYNEEWRNIHMMPEDTVETAVDLKAEILFPVHYGKFVLALHPWNEPIQRLVVAAKEKDQDYVAPKIGEVYRFGEAFTQERWWEI